MKVLHDDPDRLVPRRRPRLLSLLFLFIAGTTGHVGVLTIVRDRPEDFLLIALWCAVSLVGCALYCHTDTAISDHSTSEMRHTRRLLLWRRRTTIPLDRTRRARIAQSGGERVTRDATFLRPVLDLTPEGTPPFRLVARTLKGPGAREATDAINGRLRRRRA